MHCIFGELGNAKHFRLTWKFQKNFLFPRKTLGFSEDPKNRFAIPKKIKDFLGTKNAKRFLVFQDPENPLDFHEFALANLENLVKCE